MQIAISLGVLVRAIYTSSPVQLLIDRLVREDRRGLLREQQIDGRRFHIEQGAGLTFTLDHFFGGGLPQDRLAAQRSEMKPLARFYRLKPPAHNHGLQSQGVAGKWVDVPIKITLGSIQTRRLHHCRLLTIGTYHDDN